MSASDDYPELARLANPTSGAWLHHETAKAALDELDWLRNSVGELLARLATVATPDEWQRPI